MAPQKSKIPSLVPQRAMAVQLTEEDSQDALARFSPGDYRELTTLSYAGGLNQEQVHLNLYRERVLRHQFGFFDTSAYLIESASTLAYSAEEDADLDGYVDSLELSGVTTSIDCRPSALRKASLYPPTPGQR